MLIACAAAFLTGVFLLTRSVPMAARDLQGLAAAHAVKDTDMLQLVTGKRDFAAFPVDENEDTADAALTDSDTAQDEPEKQHTATADGKTIPTYTASTIPQVTGLTRLSEKADSITIGWDEIPGADGFMIYRRDDNDPEADFRLFSAVQKAGLTIRNLGTGSKYSFRVAAFISDGGKTAEGEPTEVTFGTAPTDVENFCMTDETKTTISMSWDKNDRADGYLMERCCKGQWSDYQTFDADTTEFTDTDLEPGRAYYYRIRAYREDSTGVMPGAKSAIRTVAGLLGPDNNGSASKLGRVSLDYKESKYADGYEIWYSKDKEDWEHLGDTTKTHYGTSRLEDGETYWFRIFPYKEVDGYNVTGSYTELDFVAKTEIYDREVGDTYVEVSLDDQHMWYIIDGDVYLDSDCVTGNYGTADTPKGFFEVNNKVSPCTLKGDDYTSYVTYWMPFIGGGWGLHDADWRSSFGGNIYKGNGSHGCVNLPPSVAKQMYAVMEIGTPVIVY